MRIGWSDKGIELYSGVRSDLVRARTSDNGILNRIGTTSVRASVSIDTVAQCCHRGLTEGDHPYHRLLCCSLNLYVLVAPLRSLVFALAFAARWLLLALSSGLSATSRIFLSPLLLRCLVDRFA